MYTEYIGSILGLCWGYLGGIWGYVVGMLGYVG